MVRVKEMSSILIGCDLLWLEVIEAEATLSVGFNLKSFAIRIKENLLERKKPICCKKNFLLTGLIQLKLFSFAKLYNYLLLKALKLTSLPD